MDPKKMMDGLNKAQTMERKTASTFSTISRMQSQAWGVAGIGFIIVGVAWWMKSRQEPHEVHHTPQHADRPHEVPVAPQQPEVAHRVADKK